MLLRLLEDMFGSQQGILDFVQSKDELAEILGHKVAHIDLEHCKKLIQVYVYTLKTTRDEDFSELANLISLISTQPFSQEQEIEADSLGIKFAYQAGFDAKRLKVFFERLEATYGSDAQRKNLDKLTDKFFFTHPMNLERAQKLEKKLLELQAYDSF